MLQALRSKTEDHASEVPAILLPVTTLDGEGKFSWRNDIRTETEIKEVNKWTMWVLRETVFWAEGRASAEKEWLKGT